MSVCVRLGQAEDSLCNYTQCWRRWTDLLLFSYSLLCHFLFSSSPLLLHCGRFAHGELHSVRPCCNINALLMDYGMVSAGLRERGGPPDAPLLLTARPTQLNYSSSPPSWMLPVPGCLHTEGPGSRFFFSVTITE